MHSANPHCWAWPQWPQKHPPHHCSSKSTFPGNTRSGKHTHSHAGKLFLDNLGKLNSLGWSVVPAEHPASLPSGKTIETKDLRHWCKWCHRCSQSHRFWFQCKGCLQCCPPAVLLMATTGDLLLVRSTNRSTNLSKGFHTFNLCCFLPLTRCGLSAELEY